MASRPLGSIRRVRGCVPKGFTRFQAKNYPGRVPVGAETVPGCTGARYPAGTHVATASPITSPSSAGTCTAIMLRFWN